MYGLGGAGNGPSRAPAPTGRMEFGGRSMTAPTGRMEFGRFGYGESGYGRFMNRPYGMVSYLTVGAHQDAPAGGQ